MVVVALGFPAVKVVVGGERERENVRERERGHERAEEKKRGRNEEKKEKVGVRYLYPGQNF